MEEQALKDKLTDLYQFFEEVFESKIKLINEGRNLKRSISIFNGLMIKAAYYFYFVKNDKVKAKQYFSIIGKLLNYELEYLNANPFMQIESVTALLLSDNIDNIKHFSSIKIEAEEDILNTIPCIQAVLRDDHTALRSLCNQTKLNIGKRGWSKNAPDLMFFEAFLEKNPSKMEESIFLLAGKFHNKRNDSDLFKELISLPALTFSKLAYIKGFQLKVSHPLIPGPLLKISPCDDYWEFDFMKDLEISNEKI